VSREHERPDAENLRRGAGWQSRRREAQANHWDRGRPRPLRAARLNIRSPGLDHDERIVRASRSLAGEGARGPSVRVECRDYLLRP